MGYILRKAELNEIELLRKLMLESLSFWSYSKSELLKLEKEIQITSELLENAICYIAETQGLIKGFWCRKIAEELSDGRFYIHPSVIGKGIGTLLWHKVITELRELNLKYITFISDQNAQGFYEKMGAIKIAEQKSPSLKNVALPIMKYHIVQNKENLNKCR